MDTVWQVIAALWSLWRGARSVERAGYLVGVALLVSGLVHVAILLVSGGSWEGPLSLRKAATFGLSFGLTLITLVWVTSSVRLGVRLRTILVGALTAACVFETGLVSLQAWRGVPSHFNVETPFDASIARALAFGGFALVVMITTFMIASFRSNPDVPPSLRIAIRIGFVLLCCSLAVGGLMIAQGMGLVFAGNPQAAYATAGSLKPIHAVTMHAVLVLPMLAWLLSFTTWTEERRVRVVLLSAAAYLIVAAAVVANTLAV